MAIVCLNWNGWRDTLECLKSIKRLDYPNYTVFVVDNGSTDDSVRRIGSAHPDVRIVPLSQNLGFARANNVGVRLALAEGAEYVCVVNNDVTLPPEFLTKAVECLRSTRAGLMGPRILDAELQDWQWPVKSRFSFGDWFLTFSIGRRLFHRTRLYRRLFYTDSVPAIVYAVPGSCMFFDARALAAIGLFDEHTFLFWEEFIVAEKLAQQGIRTAYDPRVVVIHKWNGSVSKIGPRKFLYHIDSEIYFFRRYRRYGLWTLIVVKICRTATFAWRFVSDPAFRGSNVIRQFLRYLAFDWG